MNRPIAIAILFLTLSWLGIAPDARAETYQTCAGFITSLPAVISTQGTWCLKQDLSTAMTSGSAITINTNNVTIDCNNYKLGGLAAGVGTGAVGIHGTDRQNVTVRHCNIRGFLAGVYLDGAAGGGHVVEDSRFDGNTYVGVWVQGDGSLIQRNRVLDTGATTMFANIFGIAGKYSVDIIDNTVHVVAPATGSNGSAIGITLENGPGGNRISGNSVNGLFRDGTGGGYGIFAVNSTVRVVLRDNDLLGDGNSGYGIFCASSASHAIGNTISAFATSNANCSDDGGNVMSP
jgi:nitrous oxidase accessory protein NosD